MSPVSTAAEYSAKSVMPHFQWCHTLCFSRIFCQKARQNILRMTNEPDVTWYYSGLSFLFSEYCLIDNFQHVLFHIPPVFNTVNSPTLPESTLSAPNWWTKWPASLKSVMPLSGQIFCCWHHTVWHQEQWRPLRGPMSCTEPASWNIIPE